MMTSQSWLDLIYARRGAADCGNHRASAFAWPALVPGGDQALGILKHLRIRAPQCSQRIARRI
jgi:hypothetical protein